MKDSLLTGAGVGAVTGSIAGSATNSKDRDKGATGGAAIGALVGLIASHYIHKGLEKRDAKTRKDMIFNLDRMDVGGHNSKKASTDAAFMISAPNVEVKEVKTHKKGKKLIEGHRVWIIKDTPQWILNDKK